MIDLRCPLAVLALRLPWNQIEATLAPKFEHKDREGEVVPSTDLLGAKSTVVGAVLSNAGRPSPTSP